MKKKPHPPRPWEEKPGEYFSVAGPVLCALSDNPEAVQIIKEHDLNRPALLERRIEHMHKIQQFADLWLRETNPALKEIIESEMLETMGEDKMLAFFGREFAKALGVPGV